MTTWNVAVSREALAAPPDVCELGPYRIEYKAFRASQCMERRPIVFVGKAFQNYWSFRREIERFLPERPVIVINLPGQGANEQLAPELSFDDFAKLLAASLDHIGLDRVNLVGLSYGAAIAHRFAVLFGHRTGRLVLGGVALEIHASLARILRAGAWLLDQGRCKDWSWACVLHLLNLAAREQTGVPDKLIERFFGSLHALSDKDRLRWRINSLRLLDERLRGGPACPTLVFTARYDHFIPPHQVVEVAQSCPHSQFAVLKHSDHLASLIQPVATIDMIHAFVEEEPLEFPWLEVGESAYALCNERRLLPRFCGKGLPVTLADQTGRYTGRLRDIGFHGAQLELKGPPVDLSYSSPFELHVGGDFDLSILAIAWPKDDALRAQFIMTNVDDVQRIEQLITSLGAGVIGGQQS